MELLNPVKPQELSVDDIIRIVEESEEFHIRLDYDENIMIVRDRNAQSEMKFGDKMKPVHYIRHNIYIGSDLDDRTAYDKLNELIRGASRSAFYTKKDDLWFLFDYLNGDNKDKIERTFVYLQKEEHRRRLAPFYE